MAYEIEFKLIDIKDINKIQRIEEETDSIFGKDMKVQCKRDITDEYCKNLMQEVMASMPVACAERYIGCTERIGHYEFEIIKGQTKYAVIFQQDTYESIIQLTVQIGYKNIEDKEIENQYDTFLEKLKFCIKKHAVDDWKKCVWISDAQSLSLSQEVYSEIYMAENELRAFISKVMVDKYGVEWYDKPEFYKMGESIEKNANIMKRNVPSFGDVDINIYTITLEKLMETVKTNVHSDLMPTDPEIQKEIKRRIFSTTQLDKMQGTLNYLKNKYTKKYNVWDKIFLPCIDDPDDFQKILNIFIANRNHVAHNKPLDESAKNKMLLDTQKFRKYVSNAIRKFDRMNISMEVEETLQAIEDQQEYERQSYKERIEWEAGITIRNREEIVELFCESVDKLATLLNENLYFNEDLELNEENRLEDVQDEQMIFTVTYAQNILLTIYMLVNIDDSEGATSSLKITVVGRDDYTVSEEHIEYINGQAEYDSEQTSYLPIVQDSFDDGNVETISEDIEDYVQRVMEEFDTQGYSEEIRAQDDWRADVADILEEQ